MEVRNFESIHRAGCLAVFDSQVPGAFAVEERILFENFLDSLDGSYVVLEHDGSIVGCGGYYANGAMGRLTWGMIHKKHEHQGLGKFLLYYRLRELGKQGVSHVGIETSPESEGFYARQGFRIATKNPGGLGPGRDSVSMVKRLEVCA